MERESATDSRVPIVLRIDRPIAADPRVYATPDYREDVRRYMEHELHSHPDYGLLVAQARERGHRVGSKFETRETAFGKMLTMTLYDAGPSSPSD